MALDVSQAPSGAARRAGCRMAAGMGGNRCYPTGPDAAFLRASRARQPLDAPQQGAAVPLPAAHARAPRSTPQRSSRPVRAMERCVAGALLGGGTRMAPLLFRGLGLLVGFPYAILTTGGASDDAW